MYAPVKVVKAVMHPLPIPKLRQEILPGFYITITNIMM